MLIAQQKKKENIIEYILYIWQVEDTLRAFQFDMKLIEEKIISQFDISEAETDKVRNWYSDMILMMHEEGVKKKGHLKFVSALIDELHELHIRLINDIKPVDYVNSYNFALPNIIEFKKKSDHFSNEVDVCLTALYGLLLLRLQKKDVSSATTQAVQTFSQLMAQLAVKYKESLLTE